MTPPTGDLRPATTDDAPAIATLLEAQRAEYEHYSPVFWRPAAQARAAHEPFLRMLIEQDGPVAFVTDGDDNKGSADGAAGPDGAIVALPRTDDWLVDDFTVRRPELWLERGAPLLAAVRASAPDKPITVVCGQRDEPKRTMLRQAGGRLTEEWWVRPLDDLTAPDPAGRTVPRGATGLVVTAPPVYDPGGPVCQVTSWDGTAETLRSVGAWAAAEGAVLAIVPVEADAPGLREVLRTAGYTVASEWYRFEAVAPI
jgi:hypothetical protein